MDLKALRGLSGTYDFKADEHVRDNRRNVECLVHFLDNTHHTFIISRKSKGQLLLDYVFKHLNLIETDYFCLRYLPQKSKRNGLKNGNGNNNSTNHTILNKPNHLNSHDQSPSSNASLSSSSVTNIAANHHSNHQIHIDNDLVHSHQNTNLHSPNQSHHSDVSVSTAKNPYANDENSNHKLYNNNNSYDETHSRSISSLSTNSSIEERWLNPKKRISEQHISGPPYKFFFRVRFYKSDPGELADDTTRHHLYLQLRQDILNYRLFVPLQSDAILLASYVLQSEVGDYRRDLQETDYASKYRLLPNQSDDIKRKVIKLHKEHINLRPSDAEYQFLENAKNLDCYGVEFFDAKDSKSADVRIGVSSRGLVIFRDGEKVDQFSWAQIVKIMFRKKIFTIQLRRDDGVNCDTLVGFNLSSNQACKSFWEECVAQHSFFGLHQPKTPPKKLFSFLNFGSKFQYNGKTEYQTMEESRKRSFSHFSRTPSKRYARRTIPIGRPSWNETNDSKKSSTDCSGTTSHSNNTHESHPRSNENEITHLDHSVAQSNGISQDPSPWVPSVPTGVMQATSSAIKMAQKQPICGQMVNGSTDMMNTLSYRPQSLTLKSFMYIDGSRSANLAGVDLCRNVPSTVESSSISPANPSSIHGEETRTNHVLKRSESLRIPNPIREAFSLTKKAGVSSGNQLARISESLREKFLAGKARTRATVVATPSASVDEQSELNRLGSSESDSHSDISSKTVKILPGPDGRYGFKIRKERFEKSKDKRKKSRILIAKVYPNSPADTSVPRLFEGDQVLKVDGTPIEGYSGSKVESMIKKIQHRKPPELVMDVLCKLELERPSTKTPDSHHSLDSRRSSDPLESKNTAESIKKIRTTLESKNLMEEFEKLSRKKEDESLEESKLMENIDKNRYRDILPYDSTRVQLQDSMTGDYINASFVYIPVPSGMLNKYIATQGPLSSTCDDFWQMVWEQNSSLIIMVTPLIEGGRVKCYKYWPDEKEETRFGQLLVKNIHEKQKAAMIERTIQLVDIKSGEKRITTQIQYKAWPDHEVPEDCSDFLKLVNRVRKHRAIVPDDPIIVHCSAGIGRTGVLILMETAICIMESGEPINPIRILEDMRKQRAMLIQTSSQFQFVAEAICKVYDQRICKKLAKKRKK